MDNSRIINTNDYQIPEGQASKCKGQVDGYGAKLRHVLSEKLHT